MGVDGEIMNKDFSHEVEKEDLLKRRVLDDSFKKAEVSIKVKKKEKKKPEEKKPKIKKSFRKSGVILILVAIVGILCVNYLPWAVASYTQEDTNAVVTTSIFRNIDEASMDEKVKELFVMPSYIGLTFGDITKTSEKTFYGFIYLIIASLMFMIYQVVDRLRNLSVELLAIVHCIFSVAVIGICLYIILSLAKFIGSYFVLFQNISYIPIVTQNFIIIFLNPIILAALLLIVIKVCFSMIRINFTDLEKLYEGRMPGRKPVFSMGGRF